MYQCCKYSILSPDEKTFYVSDIGQLIECDADEGLVCNEEVSVLAAAGCLHCQGNVFLNEKEMRNAIFWSMNTSEDNSQYASFFRNRNSVKKFKLDVKDTHTKMGSGLFAGEDIDVPLEEASTTSHIVIGEYVGLLHNCSSSGAYSMAYYISSGNGFDQHWQIDAKEYGGLLRFINHSTYFPNVKFVNVFYGHLWHVLVVSAVVFEYLRRVLLTPSAYLL